VLSSVERCSLKGAGTWQQLSPLTGCRVGAAAVVAADRIFLAGGNPTIEGTSAQCLGDVLSCDLNSHTWSVAAPPMMCRRERLAAVAVSLKG